MKRFVRHFVPTALLAFAFSLPALAAGDAKDLEATPQGKAYRVQEKAIKAGDYDAYKKTMTKASAAAMDKQMKEMGGDPKKGMELMNAMLPTDLKLTSMKVDKNKATLMATGKVGGEVNKGTIDFEQEDGQWKIATQSWTNAK